MESGQEIMEQEGLLVDSRKSAIGTENLMYSIQNEFKGNTESLKRAKKIVNFYQGLSYIVLGNRN